MDMTADHGLEFREELGRDNPHRFFVASSGRATLTFLFRTTFYLLCFRRQRLFTEGKPIIRLVASEGCAEMGVRARRAARGDQKDRYVGVLSVYTYEKRATRVCTYAGTR